LFGEEVSRSNSCPLVSFPLFDSAMNRQTESDEDDPDEESDKEYLSNKRLRLNEDLEDDDDDDGPRSQDDQES
jgi:hypothetical protein